MTFLKGKQMEEFEKLCADVSQMNKKMGKIETCLTGDPLDINNPGLISIVKTQSQQISNLTSEIQELKNKPSLGKLLFSIFSKTKLPTT